MSRKDPKHIDSLVDALRPAWRKVRRGKDFVAYGMLYGFKNRPFPPVEFMPGDHNSPIPSVGDIDEYRRNGANVPSELPAIELHRDRQMELIRSLRSFIDEQPFGPEGKSSRRYHFSNIWFGGFDPVILYALLRHWEPRRIIEVGSGWSTAAMLDTYEGRTLPEITLIEPFPGRLFSVLLPEDEDRVSLIESRLQDVALDEFERLESGDILFVDSTHVSKLGSDVNYLFFDILPRLAPGVILHLHDIAYPFEYKRQFIEAGHGWNEAYLLRAFLEFNDQFEIVLWNDMCHDFLHSEFPALPPLFPGGFEGSVWLRRTG